jgi:hypothetical protein
MVATPLLALWRHEDARAAVVDFLPTSTIAVLAMIAKPMREAKSCLLLTAIKRRGKTVPNPPTTRACFDTLLVGEPRYFCETWERGLEDWLNIEFARTSTAVVKHPFQGEGLCLEINGAMSHRGFVRPLRAQNLLVTRYRVTISYVQCSVEHMNGGASVAYAILSGPGAPTSLDDHDTAIDDIIAGPRFRLNDHGTISLVWFYRIEDCNDMHTLVEVVEPDTPYIVDATFNHESVNSCFGTTDVSITFNGNMWTAGGLPVMFNPLSSIHLFNWSPGISQIGRIEIWSERAAPSQVWRSPFYDH